MCMLAGPATFATSAFGTEGENVLIRDIKAIKKQRKIRQCSKESDIKYK